MVAKVMAVTRFMVKMIWDDYDDVVELFLSPLLLQCITNNAIVIVRRLLRFRSAAAAALAFCLLLVAVAFAFAARRVRRDADAVRISRQIPPAKYLLPLSPLDRLFESSHQTTSWK
jgi:hypothetical protein